MGKMKDEWFDEFYGDIFDRPRWHTDGQGSDRDSTPTAFQFRSATDNGGTGQARFSYGDSSYSVSKKVKPKVEETPELVFDIYDIQDELLAVIMSKHSDYGPKNITASPGGALNGINVRMYDKVARLDNLLSKDRSPKNESIRDSFVDIANYAIIALLVIDGKWDKEA